MLSTGSDIFFCDGFSEPYSTQSWLRRLVQDDGRYPLPKVMGLQTRSWLPRNNLTICRREVCCIGGTSAHVGWKPKVEAGFHIHKSISLVGDGIWICPWKNNIYTI